MAVVHGLSLSLLSVVVEPKRSAQAETGPCFEIPTNHRSATTLIATDQWPLASGTPPVCAASHSTPRKIVLLHPDETHDGRAGTSDGFGYRIVYGAPTRSGAPLARSVDTRALPFMREPVASNQKLAGTIKAAFRHGTEPLAIDTLILRLAEALLEDDPSCGGGAIPIRLDSGALTRAREFLDAEMIRVVRSSELEPSRV